MVLENVELKANFFGAALSGIDARGAVLAGDFRRATIADSDIVSTRFDMKPDHRPTLKGVNISGSTIPWLDMLQPAELSELYFWADWPPRLDEVNVDPDKPDLNFSGDLLDKMNICAPPIGDDRQIISIAERVGLQALDTLCEKMTAEDATVRYPKVYAPEETGYSDSSADN
jgi:hypothetical protein